MRFLGLSFNLIALLFLAHWLVPKARPHTRKFFNMAYRNPATERYGVGSDDAYFISFLVVLFTGLRAATMEHLLVPLGRMWGIKKRKTLTRFSEQAYMLLCYVVFWSLGTVSAWLCFVYFLQV
jgi:acyl-CoA-dependent ceramide synthase